MSDVLQTLASPRRREILRLVWSEERAAGEIHRSLGDVSFGAVSQHLRVLVDAQLLERRIDGRKRYYRANHAAVGSLRAWLESMWDSALYRLQLQAELEQSRRGPRPATVAAADPAAAAAAKPADESKTPGDLA